jgi:hypothetical protein
MDTYGIFEQFKEPFGEPAAQPLELAEAQTQMATALQRLMIRTDDVVGRTFELQFRERLTASLGRFLRRGKLVPNDRRLDQIEPHLSDAGGRRCAAGRRHRLGPGGWRADPPRGRGFLDRRHRRLRQGRRAGQAPPPGRATRWQSCESMGNEEIPIGSSFSGRSMMSRCESTGSLAGGGSAEQGTLRPLLGGHQPLVGDLHRGRP